MLAVTMLTGCTRTANKAPVGEPEAARIAADAEASFTSGNTAAIMSHYAPDAVIFDPGTNAPSQNRAVQSKWTDALVALRPTRFDPGKRTIQPLGPDAFISSGLATLEIPADQGSRAVHVRFTNVYQRQADGKWLIVHEHNSGLPVPESPL